jgi:hypothetical protein
VWVSCPGTVGARAQPSTGGWTQTERGNDVARGDDYLRTTRTIDLYIGADRPCKQSSPDLERASDEHQRGLSLNAHATEGALEEGLRLGTSIALPVLHGVHCSYPGRVFRDRYRHRRLAGCVVLRRSWSPGSEWENGAVQSSRREQAGEVHGDECVGCDVGLELGRGEFVNGGAVHLDGF